MDQIFQDLIQAYNNAVEERDKQELPAWKLRLRRSFLNLIIREGKSSLIDIGAGTGLHGKYFQEGGLAVTCVDLSPANVQKCLAKGLEATALNLLDLALLDRSFDSAFAMNSLLHLPTAALPQALSSIAGVLRGGQGRCVPGRPLPTQAVLLDA